MQQKSRSHFLLEHIATHGAATSHALACLLSITPSHVSSCLSHYVKNGMLKKRQAIASDASQRRGVTEYYDAKLQRYLAETKRSGRCAAAPDLDDETSAPANLVPPYTAPPFRKLNLACMGQMPQREGAWDFKTLPSHFASNKCA